MCNIVLLCDDSTGLNSYCFETYLNHAVPFTPWQACSNDQLAKSSIDRSIIISTSLGNIQRRCNLCANLIINIPSSQSIARYPFTQLIEQKQHRLNEFAQGSTRQDMTRSRTTSVDSPMVYPLRQCPTVYINIHFVH